MVQKRAKLEKPAAGQPLRRGRPRQYDPDQALAKAAAAFWKGGYAGTSLDELSAGTGMNRPSLSAALGEKRDLYLKTLERYQRKSRAKTLELLADDPPLRVFLTRFYDGALEIYRAGGDDARGCYSISTAPAQATVDTAVRAFLQDSIPGTDSFLADLIGKARRRVPQGAQGTRCGSDRFDLWRREFTRLNGRQRRSSDRARGGFALGARSGPRRWCGRGLSTQIEGRTSV